MVWRYSPKWLQVFCVMSVAFGCLLRLAGGTNEASRYALLVAMTEDHGFQIDAYQKMTIDWAQTPDGHFYSNKAPGPAFAAFPFFSLLDAVQTAGIPSRELRDRARPQYQGVDLHLLSLFLQTIPLLILVLLIMGDWSFQTQDPKALYVGCLCACFATTAFVSQTVFFGHAFSAWLCLAFTWSLTRHSIGWTAFWFGWCVLSDYALSLLAIPLLLHWVLSSHDRIRDGAKVVAGAAIPAVLWIFYHQVCFGSPFTLPNRFQNPIFVDTTHRLFQFWGIFGVPSAEIAVELLVGPSRGLLWTQPWVLLYLMFFARELFRWSKPPVDTWLPVVGFALVFLMNSAFWGWHGGSFPGPRYISAILPSLSFGIIWIWSRLGKWEKQILSLSILFSVAVQFWILCSIQLAPEGIALWTFVLEQFKTSSSAWARVALVGPAFVWIVWRYRKLEAEEPRIIAKSS